MISLPAPIVLASSSPARRHLLGQLVPEFDVMESGVSEQLLDGEGAEAAAVRLATAKGRAVAVRRPDAVVIAADTLVVCLGTVIGKPRDLADAGRMLQMLVDNPHRVLTGFFVHTPDGREETCCVSTRVTMRAMSPEEIADYVSDPAALERAGVYALQADDPNVREMQGSPSCVMGLPVEELRRILLRLYPQLSRG